MCALVGGSKLLGGRLSAARSTFRKSMDLIRRSTLFSSINTQGNLFRDDFAMLFPSPRFELGISDNVHFFFCLFTHYWLRSWASCIWASSVPSAHPFDLSVISLRRENVSPVINWFFIYKKSSWLILRYILYIYSSVINLFVNCIKLPFPCMIVQKRSMIESVIVWTISFCMTGWC